MKNILNFESQVYFKALWNLRGKREPHRGYIFTLTNQDINPDYCNKLFLLFEQSKYSITFERHLSLIHILKLTKINNHSYNN